MQHNDHTMNSPLLQEFPELSHLFQEDLEDLLVDPLYFQAIFHSLPRVKAQMQAQAELGMANEALAIKNNGLRENLYGLRQETLAVFEEAKALQEKWKEVEKEQREVYQRLTPAFLLMRLRHSTTAQDELSESLSSSFVQASPETWTTDSVDHFVKEFKEMRKTYHKRVIWGDRWASGKVQWPDY